MIIKQLDIGVWKTPNTKNYPNGKHPPDKKSLLFKNQIK